MHSKSTLHFTSCLSLAKAARPSTGKSQHGFTLIEILVVVAIVSIFPAIVISNFSQIRQHFALSRTVHAFAQDVRRAQDLALSATPYTNSFGVPQPIKGYGIYLDPSGVLGNKKYITYADSQPPGDQEYGSSDYIVTNHDFSASEPGVIIKEIQNISGTTASINFSPPNPNTVITPLTAGQIKVTVVFALEFDPLTTRTVSIYTSGLIEVK